MGHSPQGKHDKNSRKWILDVLREHGELSAMEVTEKTDMTYAQVRHFLVQMGAEGKVTFSEWAQDYKCGKPLRDK